MVNTQQIYGLIYGVAVGDTLGKPLEFKTQEEVERTYPKKLREVIAGGMGFVRGGITDDTGMTMAVIRGILNAGVNAPATEIANAVGHEFVHWLDSNPPDCGGACARGIRLFRELGDAEQVAAEIPETAGGNGALMRTAPISLFWPDDYVRMVQVSRKITRLTHATVAEWCSALYNVYLALLMQGADKQDALLLAIDIVDGIVPLRDSAEKVHRLGFFSHGPLIHQFDPTYLVSLTPDTVGEHRRRNGYNGYCVDTLRIALWAFLTTDNAEECLVETVNLGGDADSYGAVAGGLAGAYYGLDGLPDRWLEALVDDVAAELEELAECVSVAVGEDL